MTTEHKPHSELRESLAVAIGDLLLIDSPEGDSPRNIAASLREVLRGLDSLEEQLEAAHATLRDLAQADWQGTKELRQMSDWVRLSAQRALDASSPAKEPESA